MAERWRPWFPLSLLPSHSPGYPDLLRDASIGEMDACCCGFVHEACLGVQEAYIDDKDEDMSAMKAAGRIGYAMLAEWIWFVVGAVVGFLSMGLYNLLVPHRYLIDGFEVFLFFLYAVPVGALVSGLVAGYVLLNNVIIGEHSKFESRLIICGATNVIMVFVFMGVTFAVKLANPGPEPTHTPATPLIGYTTRNVVSNNSRSFLR